MDIKNLLKKIPLRGNFENVIFWGVLIVCFLAAIASTIFTASENLGLVAVVYTAFIMVYFLILGLIAFATGKTEACYVAMMVVLNTLILPPMFFICGAFGCGMPFYCITSVLLTSLIKNFKVRCIIGGASILLYMGIFMMSYGIWEEEWESFKWLHIPYLAPWDAIIDQVISYLFMALLIFTIVSYLLKAYRRESSQKDKLIEELNYMSSHDPLTGLYNRRYLIDNIRNTVLATPGGYYLLMFDVDFFKRVNDNYGHLFGDQVLKELGNLALETCTTEGELAVRYGGEEFILLLREENYDKAIVKAEQFRNRVSNIKFDNQPSVHIHISGGFVDCSNPDLRNYDKLLSTVDELLYSAKNNGRNQIVSQK